MSTYERNAHHENTSPKAERVFIGVDLGGTNVRAGRVEGLVVAAHESRGIDREWDEARVLDEIIAAIAAVWNGRVEGIGIGVPSVVDIVKGIVYSPANIPSWKEVHLKEVLEARFKVPVYVNNDGNCFALGEFHYGLGRGYQSIVGIVAGTGLGSGIITDGRLYCGANCGSGEIGHFPWREADVEYYCCGRRFDRDYGVSGAELGARARNGDAEALKIFADFGRDFAYAVQIVLYAFDPEMIVLGGSCSKDFPYWESSMREGLKNFYFPRALERLKIEVSKDPRIAVLGAAALCIDAER
jgi:glucokinase